MSKTLRLNNPYLILLALTTLFVAFIFAVPFFAFFGNFFFWFWHSIEITTQRGDSLIPFLSNVALIWLTFMSYFISKKIVITENNLIFQFLVFKRIIPWKRIIDYSQRGYYGSRTEVVIDTLFFFLGKHSSGKILEIWYKNDKGDTVYTEQNVTNFSNLDLLVSALSKEVNRKATIQKETRSLKFYIKTHKLYVALLILVFLFLFAAGISFLFRGDIYYSYFWFLNVIIVGLFWFFAVRNFFKRE